MSKDVGTGLALGRVGWIRAAGDRLLQKLRGLRSVGDFDPWTPDRRHL